MGSLGKGDIGNIGAIGTLYYFVYVGMGRYLSHHTIVSKLPHRVTLLKFIQQLHDGTEIHFLRGLTVKRINFTALKFFCI